MANHKSAIKRVRSSENRHQRNHYQHKTARTAIKKFQATTEKAEAEKLLPQVVSKIDRLVKKNIIHKNKAAHLKSEMAHHLNAL